MEKKNVDLLPISLRDEAPFDIEEALSFSLKKTSELLERAQETFDEKNDEVQGKQKK